MWGLREFLEARNPRDVKRVLSMGRVFNSRHVGEEWRGSLLGTK